MILALQIMSIKKLLFVIICFCFFHAAEFDENSALFVVVACEIISPDTIIHMYLLSNEVLGKSVLDSGGYLWYTYARGKRMYEMP